MQNRRSFIRNIGLGATFIGLMPDAIFAGDTKKKGTMLPRSSPEAQGVSSDAINKFFDAIEASGQEFHGTMIVKNGYVIAEAMWHPYRTDHKLQTYSMSKSFTSSAIGLAQQEGLLSVEDQVIKYFPNDLPHEISDNLNKLKIKHLLMMGVGMAKDSIQIIEKTPNWAKTFLSLPIDFEPGTKFLYNSGASFMLANIIQKVTGKTAYDFIKPRLLDPLGMTNTSWATTPEGYNFGASHFRCTMEDFAKFGQFYLQKGKWNGKQMLDESWVHEATTKQISNGNNDGSWSYGYGYQFWLNPVGGFRADGAFGQYSMVFPDQNAVVAIASESMGKGTTMSLVWDNLFPALKNNVPMAQNTTQNKTLQQRLSKLNYAPESFSYKSNLESSIKGKTYKMAENELDIETLTFDFYGNNISFKIKEKNIRTYTIKSGRNKWITEKNLKPKPHSLFSKRRIDFESEVAAIGGWENNNKLHIAMRLIETCHTDYLTCTFEGNKVTIVPLFSVQKNEKKPDARPTLIGHY
jgi:CubicO group peptidase (beta-lactamase class C family)